MAHLVWNASSLSRRFNSVLTVPAQVLRKTVVLLYSHFCKIAYLTLQFYGFSVIRKNREPLVGICCVTTKAAQVFIKCCEFHWLRHICYIWHIQVYRGNPQKFSKTGLDRSQMEQPIKENKFSLLYFAFGFVHKRSGNEVKPLKSWQSHDFLFRDGGERYISKDGGRWTLSWKVSYTFGWNSLFIVHFSTTGEKGEILGWL